MLVLQRKLANILTPARNGVAPKSGILAPEIEQKPKASKAAMDFMSIF